MGDKQMKQIKEQLAEGERIVRSYKAFEGDIRVITKRKGSNAETRYTVKWDCENDCPRIKLMP